MFYLGIDVAKKSLSVHLKDPLKDNPLWTNKSIPNTEKGFATIADTAIQKITKVCKEPFRVALGMESTGVYGERLAYYFYERHRDVFDIYVFNPMGVSEYGKSIMAKNKNDVADARIIASYIPTAISEHVARPWIAPPAEETVLNSLSKRREELVKMRTEEQNRVEKETNKENPSGETLRSVKRSIDFLEQEIKLLEVQIKDHIDKHPGIKSNVELMRSVPGIGDVASVVIESETNGLSNFIKVRQLVSYAGLSPKEHSSGTSVRGRSLINKRGNARIRNVLYMCAMVAAKSNPVVKEFYERLIGRGKCKKLAIIACMRKLLHIIWGVVKHGKEFDPVYAK